MGDSMRKQVWDFVTRQRRRDVADSEVVLGLARHFLNWAEQPYHQKFIEWMQAQRDQPFDMNDQMKMIASTARSNTFREILKHLEHEASRARLALESVDEQRDDS